MPSSDRNLIQDLRKLSLFRRLASKSSMQTALTTQDVIVIEAGRTEKNYWRDLWRYRELFLILAWRDVSVRYKQTVVGAAWALIRPFITMLIFTVIFGHIAGLTSDGAPYA